MRLSSLIGVGALFATSQALVACGDSDTNGDMNNGGTSGSGGSSTSGTGGMNKAGTTSGGAGANNGGGGSGAGTAGKGGMTMGGMNTGGMTDGGMDAGGEPGTDCTKDLDCFDDFNGCTDEKCVNGSCVHAPNTADCTDNNPCTDDKCDGGSCKSTNNTAVCDDKNDCTDGDKCDGGSCKGTNNTKDCNDNTSCTTGDKCTDGACKGTLDAVKCPACNTADNIIKNCDFSMMLDNWATGITFGGAADQAVVNGRDVVSITVGGGKDSPWMVQPRQESVPLEQGFKYEFGLVAGSSVPRAVDVWLVQNGGSYTPYSPGPSPRGAMSMNLTPEMQPFSFSFLMTYADDPLAKFEIDAGGDAAFFPSDLYFDDVYLRKVKCAVPADCDDNNGCTDDACDAGTGKCTWTNNTAACTDDKNGCTIDVCNAGACTHDPEADAKTCDTDGQACSVEACDKGVCKVTDDSLCACSYDDECGDGNPCTDDTCEGGLGATGGGGAGGAPSGPGKCKHANSTASCSDADVCTVNNKCAAGACDAGMNVCFDCTKGGNLLANCSFDTNLDNWYPGFFGGNGSAAVDNGMMAIHITASGSDAYMVQPLQGGLVLTEGVTYLVKFNAYSPQGDRDAVVSLTQDGGSYTSYSGPQIIHLTNQMQLFTFEFEMQTPPTEKVKFEFDLGSVANNPVIPNDVLIDNVFIGPKP